MIAICTHAVHTCIFAPYLDVRTFCLELIITALVVDDNVNGVQK